MKILLCDACGGTLEQLDDKTFICSYCGTKQIVTEAESQAKQETRRICVGDKYNAACYAMSAAKTENDFLATARLFEEIRGYKDSESLLTTCAEKAKDCRKEAIYSRARRLMSEGTPHFLSQAAELFGRIPDWRDSTALKESCQSEVARMNAQIKERNVKVKQRQDKERKRSTFLWVAVALAIFAAYLFVVFYFQAT